MTTRLNKALFLALQDIDRAMESGGCRTADREGMKRLDAMTERNDLRSFAFDWIANHVRKLGGEVPRKETAYEHSYRITGRDPDINHSGRD